MDQLQIGQIFDLHKVTACFNKGHFIPIGQQIATRYFGGFHEAIFMGFEDGLGSLLNDNEVRKIGTFTITKLRTPGQLPNYV